MKRSTIGTTLIGVAAFVLLAIPMVELAARPQPLTSNQVNALEQKIFATYRHGLPLPHTYLSMISPSVDYRGLNIEYVVTSAKYPGGSLSVPGPTPEQVKRALQPLVPGRVITVTRGGQFAISFMQPLMAR